ncbi:hypothetical protein [Paracoccus sp. (in: a-proteobacteria)]|uniref:hypothetical protein n=1 Tax=Paracoccus sp. TaxID=267 RepID=UPI00396CF680
MGDRSSDALLGIPCPDVQYYLRKLHSAGLVDASFMPNHDITYISLPLAGHGCLAKLREQTITARSRRAVAGGAKAVVLSVLVAVLTSVMTVYVMRMLTE